jgi:hypothetical protein
MAEDNVMRVDGAPESKGRAAAADECPQATDLEPQIATLAKLLPLLRAIRNEGRQKGEP